MTEVWETEQPQNFPQLIEHVLKFNNFIFNGEHYLQISCTAMGTKMAPLTLTSLWVNLNVICCSEHLLTRAANYSSLTTLK